MFLEVTHSPINLQATQRRDRSRETSWLELGKDLPEAEMEFFRHDLDKIKRAERNSKIFWASRADELNTRVTKLQKWQHLRFKTPERTSAVISLRFNNYNSELDL